MQNLPVQIQVENSKWIKQGQNIFLSPEGFLKFVMALYCSVY